MGGTDERLSNPCAGCAFHVCRLYNANIDLIRIDTMLFDEQIFFYFEFVGFQFRAFISFLLMLFHFNCCYFTCKANARWNGREAHERASRRGRDGLVELMTSLGVFWYPCLISYYQAPLGRNKWLSQRCIFHHRYVKSHLRRQLLQCANSLR